MLLAKRRLLIRSHENAGNQLQRLPARRFRYHDRGDQVALIFVGAESPSRCTIFMMGTSETNPCL